MSSRPRSVVVSRSIGASSLALAILASAGCAVDDPRLTRRDKTAKGAAIGAAAGAILGGVLGEGEADEILAGAAIGAGVGAGVGAYMDRQEARFEKIPGTTVERIDENMLRVRFDSDVLFAVDSSAIGPDSRATLGEVADVLVEFPKTAVVVQGHTDSTGSEEYNQALSVRRAESVRSFLAARGVDADRMVALGYGESEPIADNATAEGRARNRRVTILLKAKAK